MPSPIMLVSVAKFSDSPCLPLIAIFLPLLVFFLSSLDYNKDTFFKFINSKSIITFSFSLFSLVMLSHDYSKPLIVSYEEIMLLSISSLLFPKSQPFALNSTVFHPMTLAVTCYPSTPRSHLIVS
jgi:uncharacterized membrane protein